MPSRGSESSGFGLPGNDYEMKDATPRMPQRFTMDGSLRDDSSSFCESVTGNPPSSCLSSSSRSDTMESPRRHHSWSSGSADSLSSNSAQSMNLQQHRNSIESSTSTKIVSNRVSPDTSTTGEKQTKNDKVKNKVSLHTNRGRRTPGSIGTSSGSSNNTIEFDLPFDSPNQIIEPTVERLKDDTRTRNVKSRRPRSVDLSWRGNSMGNSLTSIVEVDDENCVSPMIILRKRPN